MSRVVTLDKSASCVGMRISGLVLILLFMTAQSAPIDWCDDSEDVTDPSPPVSPHPPRLSTWFPQVSVILGVARETWTVADNLWLYSFLKQVESFFIQ